MATNKVKIRRPYDASQASSITFPNTTMAKQAFKDECDINTIMRKYQKTGLFEHVQRVRGSYGDFTSVQDYQLSLNQVIEAQEAFDQLPAKIRARFANDPAHLMAFIADDANYDEAVKLGLVEPKEPKTPSSTPQPKGSQEPSGEGGTPSTNNQQPKAAPPIDGA